MSNGARLRAWRWFVLIVVVLSLTLSLKLTYPLEELDRRLSDLQFRLRPSPTTSSHVALVVIDDASLSRFGRWPWNRSLVTRLLRQLTARQPAAIGLDIVLSESGPSQEDQELARAIREAGNVVLAARLSTSPEENLWVEPLPVFAQAAAGIGHVQAITGPDGICRTLPVQELAATGPRWAMALELLRVATKTELRAQENGVSAGRAFLPTQGHPGGANTPVGEKFEPAVAWIDFRHQWAPNQGIPSFEVISAADLLDNKSMPDMRSKVVLVGLSAIDASDHIFTPVSDRLPMPGVELHANFLDALMEGRSVQPASALSQFLVLLAVTVMGTWLALRWPGRAGLAIGTGLLVAAFAFSFVVFIRGRIIFDLAPLLCAIVFSLPLAQVENLVTVNRGISQGLRKLKQVLSSASAVSTNSSATTSVFSTLTGPSLSWKLDLLNQLQEELASLYSFRQDLLLAMDEGLGVYRENGSQMFRNPRWEFFCGKQNWDANLNLEEISRNVQNSEWNSIAKRLQQRGVRLETEIQTGESLWQLRAFRMETRGESGAKFMLVATDLTPRMERDRARAEALAFVTHELLTPLTSIQGLAEFLVRYSQQDGSDAAKTIFRESRRLVALINSYLDVLRMDASHTPLRREDVDVIAIAAQVRRIMEPLAAAARSRITVEVVPDLPRLQGDPDLIAGVLLNLLNNAVKYSPAETEIRLKINGASQNIVFEVFNPGPSIPPEDLDHLFNSFYRGHQEGGKKRGWGLGLAFVKRVAEAHRGRVEAACSSAGTVFRMILPSAAQQRDIRRN